MTTRGIQGFSVVELLVATTMLAVAMAAVLAIAEPVQGIFRTQPEVADTRQRLVQRFEQVLFSPLRLDRKSTRLNSSH